MHRKKLILALVALAILIAVGAVFIPRDPLRNWKSDGETLWGLEESMPIPKSVLADVRAYVNEARLQAAIGHIAYYENNSGEHAVRLTSMSGGMYWNYVLIYDKSNSREKVIKYSSGTYGR